MLYLSKLFLLRQSLSIRYLHGFLIFSSFVVMSGCESIRLNDTSSNGYRTLFSLSDESPTVKKSTQPIAEPTPILASDLSEPNSDPVLRQHESKAEMQGELDVSKTELEHSPEPPEMEIVVADSGLTENVVVKPIQEPALDEAIKPGPEPSEFMVWLNSLFENQPEPELDERDVAQEVKHLDAKNEADEAGLIAQINALNTQQPTSAGITSELNSFDQESEYENEQPISEVLSVVQDDKPAKNVVVSAALNQRVKRAMRNANLEIIQWQLEMQREASDGVNCRLSSPTIQLDSADYTTQIWFNIENGQFILNATTHIDPTLAVVGIYLDNGKVERFSPKQHPLYVSWEGNMSELLSANQKLQLVISGTDLKSQIQLASIDLSNLRQIYPKYLACTRRVLGQR